MNDLRLQVGDLWRAANHEMHAFMGTVMKGTDLHWMAFLLLRRIKAEPGVTVGELAKRVESAKSHVSKLMDQLARRGFVEKRPDHDDQRLVRLHLTAAGTDVVSAAEERTRQAWARFADQVPEDQVADAVRGLRILLMALEKVNGK